MNLKQAVEVLQAGKTATVRPKGNSMTPLIKSGQEVQLEPIVVGTYLSIGTVVLAKVRGNLYLHKITAIQGSRVQISNNHGHVNGWTSAGKIYGRAVL